MPRWLDSKPSKPGWTTAELGRFYVENRSRLVAHANRIAQDRSLAEEIVQEAMLKVVLAAPELNDRDHALAYIRKTIDNSIIDELRRRNRRPNLVSIEDSSSEIEALSKWEKDHSEVLVEAEDAAIIREALSLLSSAERAALVMWEVQGRSAKEIADELGIKESSVRHTVSRARSSMRRILSSYVIDKDRGLTAIDLLSTSYQKSKNAIQKSSGAVVSILVLVLAYLSFTNFGPIESPGKTGMVGSSASKKDLRAKEKTADPNAKSGEVESAKGQNADLSIGNKTRYSSGSSSVKAASLQFPGLDSSGVPTGFTITDSTGALGSLFFSGKEANVDDRGIFLSSVAKTLNKAANVLVTQTISQDSDKLSYQAIIAYGNSGKWVPLSSKVLSTQLERLINGQYLLTVAIQLENVVITPISIPANTDGRDLLYPPVRMAMKIVLDASKGRILAQAIQVVEK